MQSKNLHRSTIEAADMVWPTNAVRNLLPHDILVLCDDGGTVAAIFRAEKGEELRLSSLPQKPWGSLPSGKRDTKPYHLNVPIRTAPRHYLDLGKFPFSRDDATHPPIIVSALVAPHIPRWYSGMVMVPDTGPEGAIRDDDGLIVGVRSLYVVEAAERAS